MKTVNPNNRKGQAVVETALVLFVLVLFTFGITEFGRAMYIKNMLNNAARAGARQAVVTGSLTPLSFVYNQGDFPQVLSTPPTSKEIVGAQISKSLMYVDDKSKVSARVDAFDSSGASVTSAISGNTITVTVTLNNFKSFVPNLIKITNTLTGQASMRYE